MNNYQISIKGIRQPEILVGEYTTPFDVEGLLYLTMIKVHKYMKETSHFLRELGKERNIFVYYLLGKKEYFLTKCSTSRDYFRNVLGLMNLSETYFLHEVESFFEKEWTKGSLDRLYQSLIEQSTVIPLESDSTVILTSLQRLAMECVTTYRWTASEAFSYVLEVGTLETLYPNNAFLGELHTYAFKYTTDKLHTLDLKCYIYFKRKLQEQ